MVLKNQTGFVITSAPKILPKLGFWFNRLIKIFSPAFTKCTSRDNVGNLVAQRGTLFTSLSKNCNRRNATIRTGPTRQLMDLLITVLCAISFFHCKKRTSSLSCQGKVFLHLPCLTKKALSCSL
jgi:hypothetical protein